MKSVLLLLWFAPLAYCTTHTRISCSSTTCLGHYTIKHSGGIQINVTGQNYIGTFKHINKTIHGYLVSRRRYYNYYYSGGNLDPNTGGTPVTQDIHIPDAELQQWIEKNRCQIGFSCCPGGDCYGSDADNCLLPKRDSLGNWVKEKAFTCANQPWAIFAKHTCVKDWACYIKKYSFPLHVCKNTRCTSDLDGNEIILGDGQKNQRVVLEDKSEIVFTQYDLMKTMPTTVQCKMTCYNMNSNKTICMVKPGCYLENQILSDCGSGYICNRNSFIPKNGLQTIEEYEALRAMQGRNRSHKRGGRRKRSDDDKAASKLDLLELRNYVEAEDIRTDLNLLNTLQHINEIETILIRMVTYLGYNDGFILGKILGKRIMTKYIDEEQFTICPCEAIPISHDSICGNTSESYIFSAGNFVKWNKKDACFHPDHNPKFVQLISDVDFKPDNFKEPDIVGASFQWEGWQWLSHYKEHLLDTMQTANQLIVTPLFNNIESPLFGPMAALWGYVGSNAGILALVLSIFNCLKR